MFSGRRMILPVLSQAFSSAFVVSLFAGGVALTACSEDPSETHHRVAVDLY